MKKRAILGYDLNDKYCQISYYDESKEEPQTLESSGENHQIPTMIGYVKERWVYGREAKKYSVINEGHVVSGIFEKAVKRQKVLIGEKSFDAIWLLAKFIRLSLEEFESVDFITFSVPYTDIDMSKMLKGLGQHIGVEKEKIFIEDYKESYCNYMFYQPKELWQYESALFYCDAKEIRAYMLRKLNAISGRGNDRFVTVDEVANAGISELSAIYPVLNVDRAKDADEKFKGFIENIFEKKVVSSVYLTGEGFENSWYPNSLKILCNGRRAFIGNNLYSKGACYHSLKKRRGYDEGPVYLDESKMAEQICLRMRVKGKERWYPIVAWGTHWYEADGEWEVLMEDPSDIEIRVETLAGKEVLMEKVSLSGFPSRQDYSLRLRIEVMFLDERTCKIIFRDAGFGEFFSATDFYAEKLLNLGGINGQFNSMS